MPRSQYEENNLPSSDESTPILSGADNIRNYGESADILPHNLLQLSLLSFVIAIASDSRASSHSD